MALMRALLRLVLLSVAGLTLFAPAASACHPDCEALAQPLVTVGLVLGFSAACTGALWVAFRQRRT